MAANFNKVILVGNLTRDPEVRYTPKGVAIAKVGLAINRVWRTETGEQREETTFVDIDVFGRTAEIVGQYLRKGSPALFEGRLRLDTWEDKQSGQKRSKLTIVAETVQLLGARQQGEGTPASQPQQAGLQSPVPEPSAPSAPNSSEPLPPEEDDVPF
ncbi:MAG: single-stranded DNA-binding protein [Verrucomicrobiota bacterium]|nr:single-stranded DNA-binding protein [Verrucomicrobiota bacterium]